MTNSRFDFIEYLSQCDRGVNSSSNIPSLKDISEENGISIAKLREQVSVARALGLIEVQPRTGIHALPYSFAPAVKQSLSFAISSDRKYFIDYSDLRKSIEKSYWFDAVKKLTSEDLAFLQNLIDQAQEKLGSNPPQLPHQEHKALHMTIYGKLQNVFVVGILEAYWEAYEEVGLSQYTELSYLKSVWNYHQKIINSIEKGDYEAGYQLLLEHMDLINEIPNHVR